MPRLAALVAILLFATAAGAQEGRYVFETRDDGYVRFDTVTGDISVCRMVSDQIVCRMSADERRVLEEQIDTLEARVAELEGILAEPGAAPGESFPNEAELDRTLGIMEEVFRRFHDLVEELESGSPEGDDR
jgi:tetrahydromethanopterin S-methyltransferase subunit B